jgi:hypothetical protein
MNAPRSRFHLLPLAVLCLAACGRDPLDFSRLEGGVAAGGSGGSGGASGRGGSGGVSGRGGAGGVAGATGGAGGGPMRDAPVDAPRDASSVVLRIEISPTSLTLMAGGRPQMLTAVAIYSDGSKRDVTAMANWTSSNQSIAMVSNAPNMRGYVTGVAPGGPITVYAELSGVRGMASVTVGGGVGGLTIAPSLGLGTVGGPDVMFSARTSAGATVDASWTSANPMIAQSLGGGRFRCVGASNTSVVASYMGATATAIIQCSAGAMVLKELRLSPPGGQVPLGKTVLLGLTAVYSNGTEMMLSQNQLRTMVSWKTDNPDIATVNGGLLMTKVTGTVTVVAEWNGVATKGSFTVVGP